MVSIPGRDRPGRDELQQQFNVASLRVLLAEVQHRLEELTAFEKSWDQLVTQLRPLVQACDGTGKWPPSGQMVRPRLLEAELTQLDLRARIPGALKPYPHDPLGPFLTGSLRGSDERFVRIISELRHGGMSAIISGDRFEETVGECGSMLAKYRRVATEEVRNLSAMLVEAERLEESAARTLKEQREHELAMAGVAATPTFRAWVERSSKNWPWKYVWWFLKKPLRLVWFAVAPAALAAVEGLRRLIF